MPAHPYLVKDSDALVSHCRCSTALITFPPQQACPWCGCGWLFSCIDCRKAFTFARAVEIQEPWDAIALRDLTQSGQGLPDDDEIERWSVAMQELHADLVLGGVYVCLDGLFIPVTDTSVEFTGWHARHKLDSVPQVAALSDGSVIPRVLANRQYWTVNALVTSNLN